MSGFETRLTASTPTIIDKTTKMDMSKFAKWDPIDSIHTKEDALLYLQASIDEDDGDGKLMRAVLSYIARAAKRQ